MYIKAIKIEQLHYLSSDVAEFLHPKTRVCLDEQAAHSVPFPQLLDLNHPPNIEAEENDSSGEFMPFSMFEQYCKMRNFRKHPTLEIFAITDSVGRKI